MSHKFSAIHKNRIHLSYLSHGGNGAAMASPYVATVTGRLPREAMLLAECVYVCVCVCLLVGWLVFGGKIAAAKLFGHIRAEDNACLSTVQRHFINIFWICAIYVANESASAHSKTNQPYPATKRFIGARHAPSAEWLPCGSATPTDAGVSGE